MKLFTSLFIFISPLALSAVPYPFTAGSIISAGDMNANFSYLEGRLNNLDAPSIKLNSTNYVELKPATSGASYTLRFPPSSGANGQVLIKDSTDGTYWGTPTIAFPTPGNSGADVNWSGMVLNIPTASASARGLMSPTLYSDLTNALTQSTSASATLAGTSLVHNGMYSYAGNLNIMTSDTSSIYLGTNATQRITIDGPSGNVGIGISAPSAILQAHRASGSATIARIEGMTNTAPHLEFYNLTSAKSWSYRFNSTTPGALEFCETGVSCPIYFSPGGNIGIGTTAPTSMLHVAGQITTSVSVNVASDRKLKKDITKIGPSLEKISTLSGYTYRLKDDSYKHVHLGLIAQEIETVFPQAVKTDFRGLKSVAYTELLAPIIESIKELKTQNEGLKNENQILKQYLCKKDPEATFCR